MSEIGTIIDSLDEATPAIPDSPTPAPNIGSIATLILGESGSGKTTSLKNLDPRTTLLIQPIRKPLPFIGTWPPIKHGAGSVLVTDDAIRIEAAIEHAHEIGKTIVVVDDFQYIMANEFMRRAREKGFDKFSEIGQNGWTVMKAASNAASSVRVYVMAHVVMIDGVLKAKTVGKMIDEKVVVEGMFTIVLRTLCSEGNHYFATRNSGADTVKAPIGMFSNDLIDNDLAAVDKTICEYYRV